MRLGVERNQRDGAARERHGLGPKGGTGLDGFADGLIERIDGQGKDSRGTDAKSRHSRRDFKRNR